MNALSSYSHTTSPSKSHPVADPASQPASPQEASDSFLLPTFVFSHETPPMTSSASSSDFASSEWVELSADRDETMRSIDSYIDLMDTVEEIERLASGKIDGETTVQLFNQTKQIQKFILDFKDEDLKKELRLEDLQQEIIQAVSTSLHTHPRQKAVKCAAKTGAVLQSTLQALIHQNSNIEPFRVHSTNNNIVILAPPYVAIKRMNKKTEEEENLVADCASMLSALSISDHTAVSRKINALDLSSFGIPLLTQQEREVAIDVSTLSGKFINSILSNISYRHKILQSIAREGKMHTAYKFEKIQFLTFYRNLVEYGRTRQGAVFALPDFDLYPKEYKTLYTQYRNTNWAVATSKGEIRVWDFLTLRQAWLEGWFANNPSSIAIVKGKEYVSPGENGLKKLIECLNMPWRFYSEESMVEMTNPYTKENTCYPLGKTAAAFNRLVSNNAKQYLPCLATLYELQKQGLVDHFIQYIDPLTAHFTVEMQFLDLHERNITFAIQDNEDTRKFINSLFDVDGIGMVDFKHFIFLYKQGKVKKGVNFEVVNSSNYSCEIRQAHSNNTSEVLYTAKAVSDNKTFLKSSLKRAVESPWELVLADMDFVFGEDNDFQCYTRDGQKYHMIPIRCGFLTNSQWCQSAISQEMMDLFTNWDVHANEMLDYFDNLYSPSYQRMPLERRIEVRDAVLVCFKNSQYSLTKARSASMWPAEVSLDTIRKRFAQELANIQKYERFWEYVQESISLKKKTIDLMEKGINGVKRRERFVCDFCPRITVRQRTAWLERIQLRKNYCENYQQLLQACELDVEQKISFFRTLIGTKNLPLTTQSIDDYRFRMETIQAETDIERKKASINEIESLLLEELKPTNLLIVASMFPRLLDIIYLYKYIDTHHSGVFSNGVGSAIGDFKYPLENIVTLYLEDVIKAHDRLNKDKTILTLFETYKRTYHPKDLFSLIEKIGRDNLGQEKEALWSIATILVEKDDRRTPSPSYLMEIASRRGKAEPKKESTEEKGQ